MAKFHPLPPSLARHSLTHSLSPLFIFVSVSIRCRRSLQLLPFIVSGCPAVSGVRGGDNIIVVVDDHGVLLLLIQGLLLLHLLLSFICSVCSDD